MPENIRTDLLMRYEYLSGIIAELEEQLKLFPEGRINIRRYKDKAYFYLIKSGQKDKFIVPQDNELIGQLIRKSYLERVLRAAEREASELKKAYMGYPRERFEDVYCDLPEIRKKYAKPFAFDKDRYVKNWLAEPYVMKPFKRGDPVFITLKGERVRSKSEVIIADRLWSYGIPYKYESPLKIGKKTIHPDFTILRVSDLKLLYHEHCGKMDDPEYVENRVVNRVNDYSRAGIVLGDNLFLSFESSKTPLDVSALDNLINKHFK